MPIPAAVEQVDAARLGSDVYVSFTLPMANIDEFTPADLARVEIYGYTGRTAPQRARFVELAALVGTIPIEPPPLKPGEKPWPDAETVPVGAPKQGAQVTIRDVLTPEELVQGRLPKPTGAELRDPPRDVAVPGSEVRAPKSEPPLKRFYAAVPFNHRGRPGPPGGVAEFPLLPVPEASPEVRAQYTDSAVLLSWEPSGGLIGFLLERTLPEETLPFVEDEEAEVTEPELETSGPLSYYVYREVLPDPSTPPGPREQPWRAEAPTPITGAPVAALAFIGTPEFGRRSCYTVRAVRGIGPAARIGSVSPEACLTPVDSFPPAPPPSIVTVAAEGAISLIWEPGLDADVGGYIVLRGEAPGGTLQPITAAPVRETGFRDETVTPGIRYVYAVVAVDNRFPVPNMSSPSHPVEETAR